MPDTNHAMGARAIVLDAGLSGLLMGIRLRQAGHDNFVIYEKADDVGGTWKHNIYPGRTKHLVDRI